MHEKVLQILTAQNIFTHKISGVSIAKVDDKEQGNQLLKDIIYEVTDKKTALYLSGGKSPKPLYESLAKEEKLKPGVVGLIDERYGEPLHENSNEIMIAQAGLLRYFTMRDIPYYTILLGIPIERTAQRYDELYRSFSNVYRNNIGILGIGSDGHTAGIAPNRQDFHNRMFEEWNQYEMVSWFNDDKGPFGKRITMSFLGLTMMDLILIPVFGEEKLMALKQMFDEGKEEDVPARFYKRADIAPKTLIITDQSI